MGIVVKELKKFAGFKSDFRLTISGITMTLTMPEAIALTEKLTKALMDSRLTSVEGDKQKLAP